MTDGPTFDPTLLRPVLQAVEPYVPGRPLEDIRRELGDIERAVESGTDDFLSKPVNRVELVKRVENMLKLRHVTDELERLRIYIRSMDDDQPPR